MKSVEYTLIRKQLGLSPNDVARALSVNPRTAQRWENMEEIPEFVHEWILDRLNTFVNARDNALDALEATEAPLIQYSDETTCIERTGLSLDEHNALLGSIFIEAYATGIKCEIATIPPQ